MLSKGRLSRCCLMAFLEQRKPRFSVFRFSGSLRHPGPPRRGRSWGGSAGAVPAKLPNSGTAPARTYRGVPVQK